MYMMSSGNPLILSTTTACGDVASSADQLTDPGPTISDWIWIYAAPIIFFIGLIGNILILVVVGQKRMRGTSTSDYLIIMAVADLLTITTCMIPEWLSSMDIFDLQAWSPATCKIYKFVSYTTGDAATWIRVLFTLDRFMAICFPMKKTDCCLHWRAKYYCLGVALAAVAKNMHVFWTRGAEYHTEVVYETVDCVAVPTNETVTVLKSTCGYPKPEYYHFEVYVRPWIVFALVNLMPFCVILVCNLFIIRTMIVMKRTKLQRSSSAKSSDKQLFQTTAMCLAASFSFLICVTPTMILLIGKPYWTETSNLAYDISKAISNLLLYVINSINFFLYCITGQRFRETLVMVMRCKYDDARRKSEAPSSVYQAPGRGQGRRGGGGGGERSPEDSEADATSSSRKAGTGHAAISVIYRNYPDEVPAKLETTTELKKEDVTSHSSPEMEEGCEAALVESGRVEEPWFQAVEVGIMEDESTKTVHKRASSDSSSGVSSSSGINATVTDNVPPQIIGTIHAGDWTSMEMPTMDESFHDGHWPHHHHHHHHNHSQTDSGNRPEHDFRTKQLLNPDPNEDHQHPEDREGPEASQITENQDICRTMSGSNPFPMLGYKDGDGTESRNQSASCRRSSIGELTPVMRLQCYSFSEGESLV